MSNHVGNIVCGRCDIINSVSGGTSQIWQDHKQGETALSVESAICFCHFSSLIDNIEAKGNAKSKCSQNGSVLGQNWVIWYILTKNTFYYFIIFIIMRYRRFVY